MTGPSMARAVLTVLVVIAPLERAQAQESGAVTSPRFTFGADLSALLAPVDDEAFFNYTNYEQDGLRVARARLFGGWRVHASLQAVVELRIETGRTIDVAAWYLSWRPWRDRAVAVQAGRIPPVFGAFPRRAYGRDNPVMGMPLAYQYLTSLRPDAAPVGIDDVLRMRGRGWQPSYPIGATHAGPGLPLVSATEWSTGVQAIWRRNRVEAAGAVTQGSPSQPGVLERDAGVRLAGRVGVDLPGGAIVGASFARGRWMERALVASLLADDDDATEQAVGVDAEYGRGAWLLRAEWIRTVHELPLAAPRGTIVDLASQSGFAEVRWRPHPRWQVAGRAEYLRFGHVQGVSRPDGPWDAPVRRLEAAIGYRVSRRLDVRGGWQHNWRDGGRIGARGFPMASVLYWF